MRRLAAATMAGPSLSASPASGENPTDVSERKRIRMEGTVDPTSSSSGDDVEVFSSSPSVDVIPTQVPSQATEVNLIDERGNRIF